MTASSPMSVQGQPAVIVPATTQTPKAMIPAEIRNESTVSMIGPLSSSTAGRHRRHAGAVTREGGAAGRDRLRASAPPPRKIGTPYGGLRRPTGRDLRSTNATSRSCGARGDLMQAAVAQSAAVAPGAHDQADRDAGDHAVSVGAPG